SSSWPTRAAPGRAASRAAASAPWYRRRRRRSRSGRSRTGRSRTGRSRTGRPGPFRVGLVAQRQRLPEVLARAGQVVQAAPGDAAVVVGLDEVPVERDGSGRVLDRAGVVAERLADLGALVVGV